MDSGYFLKQRLEFIRQYYENCVEVFKDTKLKIEEEIEPFDNPPYSEDPEPAFLKEWLDAATSIEVTGAFCVSLLSDSLKLYFQSLAKFQIGLSIPKENFRNGIVPAYRQALGEVFETDWTNEGIEWSVIEQVVLARNSVQHGKHLPILSFEIDQRTFEKYPKPFFVDDKELEGFGDFEISTAFYAPKLEISEKKLLFSIEKIDQLVCWIERNMDKAHSWRMH